MIFSPNRAFGEIRQFLQWHKKGCKKHSQQKIFETEHVDLQHLYIDESKFEATANKYSWVWKKATEKSRYRSDMDCFIPLMKKIS